MLSWTELPKRPRTSPAHNVEIDQVRAESRWSAASTAPRTSASSRPVDLIDDLTDGRVASLPGTRTVHRETEGIDPLEINQLPGKGLQSEAALEKSRSGPLGPSVERLNRSRELMRAAIELVSVLDSSCSDTDDESTSDDGPLSAASATSSEFARVMSGLDLSPWAPSEEDGHDVHNDAHARSPCADRYDLLEAWES